MAIQFGNPDQPALVAKLSVTGGASDANVFEYLANPWGIDVIVTRAILRVTTVATAAATLDIGPAANATTANDTLFDGLDVNAATGVFDNLNDTHNGTNGVLSAVWADDGYITVKEASGNVDGLVGTLHLLCVPA
jgi:hypothetical protein